MREQQQNREAEANAEITAEVNVDSYYDSDPAYVEGPGDADYVPGTYFDFASDCIFTAEPIIRECFSNPDRKKFKEICMEGEFSKYELCPEEFTEEHILDLIKDFGSVKNMETDITKLYSTERLMEETDKAKWVSNLKKLKWFGPFNVGFDGPVTAMFFKAMVGDDENNHLGIVFYISLESQWIEICYRDEANNSCGFS